VLLVVLDKAYAAFRMLIYITSLLHCSLQLAQFSFQLNLILS